jgi:hypothetical protein
VSSDSVSRLKHPLDAGIHLFLFEELKPFELGVKGVL